MRLEVPSPLVLGPMANHCLDVAHHRVGCAALGGQSGKNPVEHPDPAPADETVIERSGGPWVAGASRHISPPRMTWTMPLITLRSSIPGTPRGLFGRSGCNQAN